VPTVAVKMPETLPAGTVTGVATRRAKLLALRATAVPPEGAALERVTAQVLLVAEWRLVGLHVSEASWIGATKERDADAGEALYVAVTVAV
jgi:hypothetical protein